MSKCHIFEITFRGSNYRNGHKEAIICEGLLKVFEKIHYKITRSMVTVNHEYTSMLSVQ